jgi:hypothetical protein
MDNGVVLKQVLSGLLDGLRDVAIPVQAAAACSIRFLLNLLVYFYLSLSFGIVFIEIKFSIFLFEL